MARSLSASPCDRRDGREGEAIRNRATMVHRRAVFGAEGFGRRARGASCCQSGVPGEIRSRFPDLCQWKIERRDTKKFTRKNVERTGTRIAQRRQRAAQDHAAAPGETSQDMSEITTHVLDISIGHPAAGVRVILELEKAGGGRKELSQGATDGDVLLRHLRA